MRQLNNWLNHAAGQWKIVSGVVKLVFWLPFAGAALLAISRLDKEVYRFLLAEDGPVEWLTVVFCIAAFAGGAGMAVRRAKAGFPGQATIFGVAGVVMLFVAIEEISWGQRVFGIETPEFFELANKQRELNIHNIGVTLSIINVGTMLVGAYAVAIHWLNPRLRLNRILNVPDYYIVPPAFLSPAFLLTFLYRFLRMFFFPESGFTITRYAEYIELCLAFAVASTLWLTLRRSVQESREPAEARAEAEAV